MTSGDTARLLAFVACLPSSAGFSGLASPGVLRRGELGRGAASWEGRGQLSTGSLRAMPLLQVGRRVPHASRQVMFSLSSKTDSDGATLSKSESDLDIEESRALEELSSILTTDDGLRLSGAEMREARSNWVRDLMSTGQSRVLIKVSSRLAVSVIIASIVAAVSNWSPKDSWWLEFFEVPGWPHELVGGFLAILLVFRTDQAYGRFWEGRTQWSTLAAELRSLARVTVANRQIISTESLDEVLAHLSAFPVAFKQHLRGENDPGELRAIYESFDVGSDGVRRILQVDEITLTLTPYPYSLTLILALPLPLPCGASCRSTRLHT
jgi:hypothetical protein